MSHVKLCRLPQSILQLVSPERSSGKLRGERATQEAATDAEGEKLEFLANLLFTLHCVSIQRLHFSNLGSIPPIIEMRQLFSYVGLICLLSLQQLVAQRPQSSSMRRASSC